MTISVRRSRPERSRTPHRCWRTRPIRTRRTTAASQSTTVKSRTKYVGVPALRIWPWRWERPFSGTSWAPPRTARSRAHGHGACATQTAAAGLLLPVHLHRERSVGVADGLGHTGQITVAHEDQTQEREGAVTLRVSRGAPRDHRAGRLTSWKCRSWPGEACWGDASTGQTAKSGVFTPDAGRGPTSSAGSCGRSPAAHRQTRRRRPRPPDPAPCRIGESPAAWANSPPRRYSQSPDRRRAAWRTRRAAAADRAARRRSPRPLRLSLQWVSVLAERARLRRQALGPRSASRRPLPHSISFGNSLTDARKKPNRAGRHQIRQMRAAPCRAHLGEPARQLPDRWRPGCPILCRERLE